VEFFQEKVQVLPEPAHGLRLPDLHQVLAEEIWVEVTLDELEEWLRERDAGVSFVLGKKLKTATVTISTFGGRHAQGIAGSISEAFELARLRLDNDWRPVKGVPK